MLGSLSCLFFFFKEGGVRERERWSSPLTPLNPDDHDLPSSVSHSPSTDALFASFLNIKNKIKYKTAPFLDSNLETTKPSLPEFLLPLGVEGGRLRCLRQGPRRPAGILRLHLSAFPALGLAPGGKCYPGVWAPWQRRFPRDCGEGPGRRACSVLTHCVSGSPSLALRPAKKTGGGPWRRRKSPPRLDPGETQLERPPEGSTESLERPQHPKAGIARELQGKSPL